jgi:microcystin degradation protein MlrC
MCIDAAQGNTQPTMAMFDCKMINLYPTANEPMRSLVDHLKVLDSQSGIISVDIAHGFPWGDVEDCGTRVLSITDNNKSLAQQTAKDLGEKIFNLRHELQIKPLSMESAIAQALQSPETEKPAVIADMSDNSGGGAPSDSTFLLKYLLENKIQHVALGMIYDPQVVEIAMKAGEGTRLKLRLGGKTSPDSGDPLDIDATVIGCIKNLIQPFPQSDTKSLPTPCGDSVCLESQGIYIIVNSIRTQPFHPDIFTKFGLLLSQLKVLIVKSIFHFHAGFAPVASSILLASPPGALNMRFTEIPYQKANLDKFPWRENPG